MPPTDESQDDLSVTRPKSWAAGVPGVKHALQYALGQTSTRRTALTLRNLNQVEGIDCPGCAWPEPDPDHRHMNEYCENGVKHVTDEATSRRVTRDFFAEHSVAELDKMAGRS